MSKSGKSSKKAKKKKPTKKDEEFVRKLLKQHDIDPDDFIGKSEDDMWLKVMELAMRVPPVVLDILIFTLLWWRAYGAGRMPTKGDFIAGVIYGVSVRPALQGGILSNTYGLAVMGVLGAGFMPPDIIDAIAEGIADHLPSGLDAPANAIIDIYQSGPPPYQEFKNQCEAGGGQLLGPQACKHDNGKITMITDWSKCYYRQGGTWNFETASCILTPPVPAPPPID